MALPTPPNINTPIPNSTFYSDPTWNLVGSQGPLIVGQGLEIIARDGEVIAIPQAVGVNSITAGLGISVDQPDGDVTITNTGVLSIQAGPHIQISGTAGTVVVEAVLPQFVDSIIGVTPVQVGGTALQPLISIDQATTISAGIIQLYDATDSTSVTQALTAAQGKYLQDQISALVLSSSNLLFAGTIAGNTGLLTAVTPEGTAEGFAVGAALPAPALTNTGYFVIVTHSGTFTPTGATSPVSATKGDWVVSSGTNWDFLDVGFDAEPATTTDTGIVRLATDAETITGTADTVAVTPASLQSKVSDSTALVSSNDIASSLAVKNAYDLAAAALPKSILTSKGSVIAGTGVGTAGSVSPSVDGLYLKSDLTCAAGVKWASAGTVRQIDTGNGLGGGPIFDTGVIVLENTCVVPDTYTYATFTVDSTGRITDAQSGENPLTCQNFAAAGDILVGEGASAFSALPVGNDGEALIADSTCATALKWAPICQGTVTSITAGHGLDGGTITGSGTICLLGTNVCPGTYTNATVTVDELGRVLGAFSGNPGVTSIAAGTGLLGGVITTSGTIELANTTVTPGTYTNATVTVDAQGRVTSAVNGSGGGGGAAPAYAQNALTVPVGFPPTQVDGTIMTVSIATSGNPVTIMATGTAQGCEGTGIGCVSIQRVGDGTNQSPQWIEATRFMDQTFAISHVEKPAAGVHTYALVYNSAVGVAECGMCFGASGACGPILSAFEIGGGGQVNAIECTSLTAVGDLIVASAPSTPTALPVGSDGFVLTTNSSCALGMEWATPAYPTDWISAGLASDCIFSSNCSTNVPQYGVVDFDEYYYRRVGPKMYEVYFKVVQSDTVSGNSGGVPGCDYIIKLPTGLSFDLTAPFQSSYQGSQDSNSYDFWNYMLPSTVIGRYGNYGSSGNAYPTAGGPVIWDQNYFRLVYNDGGVRPIGQGWYNPVCRAAVVHSVCFTMQVP